MLRFAGRVHHAHGFALEKAHDPPHPVQRRNTGWPARRADAGGVIARCRIRQYRYIRRHRAAPVAGLRTTDRARSGLHLDARLLGVGSRLRLLLGPGRLVLPPQVGVLWTPGWWGWD